jgi:hypothetical protein
MPPGTKVKCPKCTATFETPDPNQSPVPRMPFSQPSSPVPSPDAPTEGGVPVPRSVWQDEPLPPGEAYPPRHRGIADLSPHYQIDMAELLGRARANWGAVLMPMVGYGLLTGIIMTVVGLIPCIGQIILVAIGPPLQAGPVIVALYQLQQRSWTFNDFFSGFNWWGPIWVVSFLSGLVSVASMAPGGVAILIGREFREEEMVVIGFAIMVLGYLAVLYFLFRATLFAIPLIVDRRCGAIDAMRGSWRLTSGHFLGWFGVALLMGMLVFAPVMPGMSAILGGSLTSSTPMILLGVLLLIGGLFLEVFIVPFPVLVMTAGYLAIAGRVQPVD